jgi:hypothetical protein
VTSGKSHRGSGRRDSPMLDYLDHLGATYRPDFTDLLAQ